MESSRSNIKARASRVAPRSHGNSAFSTVREKGNGTMNAVTPSTRPMFAMFEPMALPTASSGLPSTAAVRATSISGAEVPTETTVRPMSIFGTRKCPAVLAAPERNRSALQRSAMNPMMSAAIETSMF